MQLDKEHLYYDNYNAWFFKYGKDLYKIFKNIVPEKLELQLYYNRFIEPEVDNHIILPTELTYDNDHCVNGYKMNFVRGTNLLCEIKRDNLIYEDKVFIINELFSLLEHIHDYLVIGDVRNSNIMIDRNKEAYLIDLDFAQRSDVYGTPFCRYHLRYNDEYLNNRNEDVLKMFMCALSLLYNYDIEHEFSRIEDVESLRDYVPLNGLLNEYYYYMLDCVYKNINIDNYLKIPFDSNIEKDVNYIKSRILSK